MSPTFYFVESLGTTGQTYYFVIRGLVAGVRQVWNPTLNSGAGGWESYNSSHWAQYAIPMTEDAGSGYFSGAYPGALIFASISGAVLTTEVIYLQGGGTPSLSDVPASGIGQSQGVNVAAVAALAQAAQNEGAALSTQQVGAIASTPSSPLILPTNLASTTAGTYDGRAILMTSGAVIQQAAFITAYDGAGLVTINGFPSGRTPASGDTFVIV